MWHDQNSFWLQCCGKNTRLLNGCLIQTWETSVENVSIHIVPSQLTGEGVDRFYGHHHRRHTKYHFGDVQVRPVIENNPADPKGGWNMWGISWICPLVAHWWLVSAAACVCEPGTVGWRQELPKRPPKGHNRKWNVGVLLWPRNQSPVQWESHLWHP